MIEIGQGLPEGWRIDARGNLRIADTFFLRNGKAKRQALEAVVRRFSLRVELDAMYDEWIVILPRSTTEDAILAIQRMTT